MKHQQALDDKKFDRRLVNWNLKRGVITKEELNSYLNSLDDSATNARTVEIEVEEDQALETLN